MAIQRWISFILFAAAMAASLPASHAGPLRERLWERMAQREAEAGAEDAASCAEWAQRVQRLQSRADGRNAGPAPDYGDVAYGSEPLQKLDVFLPAKKTGAAPIIVMVHGGGWCVGDKAAASVTANKVARWTPKGFIFVSVNYPMVNEGSNALAQAGHLARAVAYVQAHAAAWGGDANKVILMGHSAGAHLVSLVNADRQMRESNGMHPVLGTVSLDAGAVNVVTQMPQVYPFLKARYIEAFGNTENEWTAASPYHRLDRSAAPWLGVCSTQRKDDPCGQAHAYADKSQSLAIRAAVLPQGKSHGAINQELGLPGAYTDGVEAFMASLDPQVARLLNH